MFPMKILRVLAPILAFYVCSCSTSKNEAVETSDLEADSAAVEISAESVAEEDDENINDEDHGDPGMEGQIIDAADVEPDVKMFLASLTEKQLHQVITADQEILITTPGPGVNPIYQFASSEMDLMKVSEFRHYTSDSLLRPATTYRMVWDVCEMEGFPEGIYLRDVEFRDISLSDSDEIINEKLQRFLTARKSETGVAIFIKFRSETDQHSILQLLCSRKDGKLFLSIVDQRECGA
jgi:hypothetical protein